MEVDVDWEPPTKEQWQGLIAEKELLRVALQDKTKEAEGMLVDIKMTQASLDRAHDEISAKARLCERLISILENVAQAAVRL